MENDVKIEQQRKIEDIPLMYRLGDPPIVLKAAQVEGEVWVPVADVAAAIGVKRHALKRILLRNPVSFDGFVQSLPLARKRASWGVIMTPHEVRTEMLCVNTPGLIGLLMKVSERRIKNPDAQAKIVEFQRWAWRVLGELVSGRRVIEGCSPLPLLLSEAGAARTRHLEQLSRATGMSVESLRSRLARAARRVRRDAAARPEQWTPDLRFIPEPFGPIARRHPRIREIIEARCGRKKGLIEKMAEEYGTSPGHVRTIVNAARLVGGGRGNQSVAHGYGPLDKRIKAEVEAAQEQKSGLN